MISSKIKAYEGKLYPNVNKVNISSLSNNTDYLSNDPAEAKLWIAGVLGFNSGIFLVIL